jgi:hypothetical protein
LKAKSTDPLQRAQLSPALPQTPDGLALGIGHQRVDSGSRHRGKGARESTVERSFHSRNLLHRALFSGPSSCRGLSRYLRKRSNSTHGRGYLRQSSAS